MLVEHAGMLAADEDVLLSNTDNNVARHTKMMVLDNGVLISSTEAFLSYKRGCLGGPCKGMLILDKAIYMRCPRQCECIHAVLYDEGRWHARKGKEEIIHVMKDRQIKDAQLH